MTTLYPEIEPYKHGMLECRRRPSLLLGAVWQSSRKTGTRLAWWPGSSCSRTMRRFFNPALYNIILFDQRNSGRSTPHAKEFDTDLSTNANSHLIAITMTRRAEIDWLYHGVGRLFPEQHARFRAGVATAEHDGDLVAAYYRLLQNPDPAVHRQAAHD